MTASGPDVVTLEGGESLRGFLRVPGDKSVSHRALLVGALADGRSDIEGLSPGEDVAAMAGAVAALGAVVDRDAHSGRTIVQGGRARLAPPTSPIDLGNAGTAMRLLAGVAATLPGTTSLTGDDSLRSRPMDRVAEPLGRMGARVVGQGPRCLPPLEVSGAPLVGIDFTPPMASAQVKSAVLFAGLTATGETVVREPVPTRTATEDLLTLAGARLRVSAEDGQRVVRLQPSELRPISVRVPGDPSQAAFWLVGALLAPESRVTVEDVDLAPERVGYLSVLERMGARLETVESGPGRGSITAATSTLRATDVDASEIPSLDEVPVLAVAAARAKGTTRFSNLAELRVKESDRLAATASLLEGFGATASITGDDLFVTGANGPLRGVRIDAQGDHRMAMAAAVAAAAGSAPGTRSVISGWATVATSYPGFLEVLADLGNDRVAR